SSMRRPRSWAIEKIRVHREKSVRPAGGGPWAIPGAGARQAIAASNRQARLREPHLPTTAAANGQNLRIEREAQVAIRTFRNKTHRRVSPFPELGFRSTNRQKQYG